jgi:hypothetical protein
VIDQVGTDPDDRTHVRVVRGEPDDIELAALVAGLVAAAGEPPDDVVAPGAWSDRSRGLRTTFCTGPAPVPGADRWRWSLRD